MGVNAGSFGSGNAEPLQMVLGITRDPREHNNNTNNSVRELAKLGGDDASLGANTDVCVEGPPYGVVPTGSAQTVSFRVDCWGLPPPDNPGIFLLLSRFLPSGVNGYPPEEIRLGVLLTLHDDNPNGVAGNILSKREIAMLLCNKLGINDGFGEWRSIDMATADSDILDNDKIVPEVGGTSLVGIITGVRDKLTFGDGGWFSPFLPPRSISMPEVTSPFPDGHQATRQLKYATNDAGLAWLGLEDGVWPLPSVSGWSVCC